ncbi:MAG: endonuclease, partial [Paracoccus sp. (in: a-proteobacteria)]|nr:endonuclease [Paracoccus sp. (in: a-proteobacteria)]
MSFEFSGDRDVEWVRRRLIAAFGWPEPFERRSPAGQLIKSMISARTRDEISLRAYLNLRAAYPNLAGLAAAPAPQIEALIADVTFADVKARRVKAALGTIAASRPDFDLGFLRARGVRGALAWLERLPGVGRKASASTLNFSTLNMPA